MIKLEPKKDIPKGYYIAFVDDKKYSVVDFSTTMKDIPLIQGLFLGWEAVLIKEDGDLDCDVIFRGDSWEQLKEQL